MSHRRISATLAGAALGLITAVSAAPATAGSEVTYDGTFTGIVFDTGCTNTAAAPSSASGTWRVNAHATKATARFLISVDGVPHVAWTTQMTRVPDPLTSFTATTTTPAGPLTVTLQGTTFTYRISPYNVDNVFPGWPICEGQNGVTYFGVVGSAD